jgi:hypothetical protein
MPLSGTSSNGAYTSRYVRLCYDTDRFQRNTNRCIPHIARHSCMRCRTVSIGNAPSVPLSLGQEHSSWGSLPFRSVIVFQHLWPLGRYSDSCTTVSIPSITSMQ